MVGNSTKEFVEKVFRDLEIPSGVNDTLISFILKCHNPESIGQFRPISLCNTSYKLITKILVNRLRPFFDDLVSTFQSSFVPGRRAADNVVILGEAIYVLKNKKWRGGLMIVKLDLEKAYDRLEWSFIKGMLRFFNFPENITKLIMNYITTTSINVLFNGGRLDGFQPSRGIRQGDKISPSMFILCLEYLSRVIDKEVTQGNWRGIRLPRGLFTLSHLFSADDLIISSRADMKSSQTLWRVLQTFCATSVSASEKSFSGNTNLERRHRLARMLELGETEQLGRYLGFPMEMRATDNRSFNIIIDRVKEKLEG